MDKNRVTGAEYLQRFKNNLIEEKRIEREVITRLNQLVKAYPNADIKTGNGTEIKAKSLSENYVRYFSRPEERIKYIIKIEEWLTTQQTIVQTKLFND